MAFLIHADYPVLKRGLLRWIPTLKRGEATVKYSGNNVMSAMKWAQQRWPGGKLTIRKIEDPKNG